MSAESAGDEQREFGKRFDNPNLRVALRHCGKRTTSPIFYLAIDYLTIAAVSGVVVGWSLVRQSWNWSWGFDVPTILLGIVLMGGLQHRLAGLGHESSHFILFKNRLWMICSPISFACSPSLRRFSSIESRIWPITNSRTIGRTIPTSAKWDVPKGFTSSR